MTNETVDIDIYRGYQGDKNIKPGRQKCYTSDSEKAKVPGVDGKTPSYKSGDSHSEGGAGSASGSPSTSDTTHETPLVVEFGDGKNEYYTTIDGTNWTKQGSIRNETLKGNLDKQNCERRNRHVIDISKKNGEPEYKCPGCKEKISVFSSSPTSDYTYYTHSIRDCCIGELRYDKKDQTGLMFSGMISKVYVYWSKWEPNKPLLIYLAGENSFWYQRENLSKSNWKPVSQYIPGSFSDSANISKILLEYHSPKVTINLGEGKNLTKDKQSVTYTNTSVDIGHKDINLQRNDVEIGNVKTGYTSFSHSVQSKSAFILGGIKHTSPLSGISLSLIITTVTAYYHGQDPSDENKLLLVSLEKRNEQNKHLYYSRPLVTGGTWTREEHENPLQPEELQKMLDALKMAHFPESNTGTLAGSSVGSGLGGAGLGALAVWKGPAILSNLPLPIGRTRTKRHYSLVGILEC